MVVREQTLSVEVIVKRLDRVRDTMRLRHLCPQTVDVTGRLCRL